LQKQSKIINQVKLGKNMAITDIQISDELQAGAPSIKYRGNEGPQSPMEMAMADPMLIEEYKKYVYSMQEQGQEPVSFEQFVQEIMSGMADGGRAGYGFGSFVKKITNPIKKVVKNPVGQAVVGGLLLDKFGVPGTGGMGESWMSKIGPLGKVGLGITALSALPLMGIGMGKKETLDTNIPDSQKFDMDYSQMRQDIGDAVSSGVEENFHEVLDKYNLTEGVNINFWEDIRKPSAKGGPAKKKKKKYKRQGMEFDYPLGPEGTFNTLNPPKRYEVAEGGIMDLGGMEKDYRNTGGFVDLGAEEKADDVPARLSVNEFVMTADAVRGAGEGDVDKGAEVMEDMMETLEQKGRMTRGAMMPIRNFPSNMKSRMQPMADPMDSGIAEVLKGTIESIGPSFHGGQQLQELETISDGGGMLNIKRQDPGGIPNIKRMQGGPQYLQRMQHLMSLGYSYAEAARIAADSNRYYNIVGSGARRGASDMFEVSERLSEVV
jgi:hypothetical protein